MTRDEAMSSWEFFPEMNMKVRVEVKLVSFPEEKDLGERFEAAKSLSIDERSVFVHVADDAKNVVAAEFTIRKVMPMAVVDDIAARFRRRVRNYDSSTLSFREIRTGRGAGPEERYTPKQGQYLAFIHDYTKLHGRPPAEAEIQRCNFKTTPPAVHSMVKQLENKGIIKRTPRQACSTKLLLSREELPDLEWVFEFRAGGTGGNQRRKCALWDRRVCPPPGLALIHI